MTSEPYPHDKCLVDFIYLPECFCSPALELFVMPPLTFSSLAALSQETLRVAYPPPKMENISSVTRVTRHGRVLWLGRCSGAISRLEILWDDQSKNIGRWRIKARTVHPFWFPSSPRINPPSFLPSFFNSVTAQHLISNSATVPAEFTANLSRVD